MKVEFIIQSIYDLDLILKQNNITYCTKKTNKRNEILYILNSIEEENLYCDEVIKECINPFINKEKDIKMIVIETSSFITIQITEYLQSNRVNPSNFISNDIIEFCYLCNASIDFDLYVI